jgi:hypothetical protein
LLEKVKAVIKNEKGVISGEAVAIGTLIALGAFMAFNILRPYLTNTTNILGGKVQNLPGTNNPAW